MNKKLKIIIDTDIGDDIDDAFALMLAAYSNAFEIIGVTTVYKNCDQRAKIVKTLLNKIGLNNVPVYAGYDNPKIEPIKVSDFEQIDADGKIVIPHFFKEMCQAQYSKGNAIDFIAKKVSEYPNEIMLVCIGPLTNIAAFSSKYPDCIAKVKKIIIMGGSSDRHRKEWNFRCDPEAAKTVINLNCIIRVIGINITEKCVLTSEYLERIRALKGDANEFVVRMMEKYISDYQNTRMPCMHDPLVIGTLIDDFCEFSKNKGYVLTDEANRGCIVFEKDENGNIEFAESVYQTKFLNFMLNLFEKNSFSVKINKGEKNDETIFKS